MSSILSNVGDLASRVYGVATGQTQKYGSPTETIEEVFSQLDATGKGYLDAADFESAFESLGLGSGDGSLTETGVEEVVSALDVDGDGRVTTDDMTQGLQALTDSLGVLRGQESPAGPEAVGAMPPPPPTPEQVLGFTEEELASQYATLTSAEDADPEDEGTQLLASILDDFESADADGDGRVSGEEAMAFAQSLQSATAAAEAESESVTERVEDGLAAAAILDHFDAADADGDGLLSSEEVVAYAQAALGGTDDISADSDVGADADADAEAVSATTADGSTEQLVMRRIMALMDAYGSSSSSDSASDLLSELA
ncbi:EF-hand domain-containing protein [Thiorhodococcus minor]|uniref:EF-hand domain-containing protein n=1 Tax=Thiorhodococcus minor TaxID=57489 RepID=A0A6M0JW00_9GAMM|nr:EF-hand domain-containing protein [Thiorhodococcus minor]NEV61688.1 EF-hand domain-containing protein [Thiorhodococcus minor]